MSHSAILLSIVMPVFNNEQYISATLGSLLSQIDNSVEVLVVNDGSTDNSKALIEQQIRNYPQLVHIHCIDQPNSGVSAARNNGLALARGDYIGFVDGDDILSPWFWPLLKPLLETRHSDLIEFNYAKFCDRIRQFTPCRGTAIKHLTNQDIDHLHQVFRRSHWHVWSRIYRRPLLAKRSFHEGRRYEDMMFTPWVYFDAPRITAVNEVLYYYRDNLAGITRNILETDIADMLHAMQLSVDAAASEASPAIRDRVLAPMIANNFYELKCLHAKIYGFYNYDDATIALLRRASRYIPPGLMKWKHRLHVKYPGLWKTLSRLRRRKPART